MKRCTPMPPPSSWMPRGESRLTRSAMPRRSPPVAPAPWSVPLAPAAAAEGRKGGSGSGRRESFPKAVADLIDARDPWCVHCGSPRDLQRHHRRIKGQGGDPRPHTDCACNGVRICLACHDWAHSGKGRCEAEDEGLIIPRSTVEPRREGVYVHLEDDRGGMLKYPSCDGRWLDAAELAMTA